MLAKTLMVQGTASSVGKSLLVAALCRIARRKGIAVAPFKAQNMALNAAVTIDGLEIGRAQAVQAQAAGILPRVEMNPVLLKPEGGRRSQLVLMGKPHGHITAADSLAADRTPIERAIADSLATLRREHELVIIEGAGSPAEINLAHRDLVNMHVARLASAPVLLVGDIDRGGVFAALLGTLMLLADADRERVAGLIVNKFRGDPSLFEAGVTMLEERAGKPVLGVVPMLPNLRIADEDSVSIEARDNLRRPSEDTLDIVVLRLPHIANHDDVLALEREPNVCVRFCEAPADVLAADLVIVPGSKHTVADLAWLRAHGLADALQTRASHGAPILGICGGCQMLGTRIEDPAHVESSVAETTGLDLLPIHTRFEHEKITAQVHATLRPGAPRTFITDGLPEAVSLTGYEIHHGQIVHQAQRAALFDLARRTGGHALDGAASASGRVVGTLIHGLLDNDALRQCLLANLRVRRGLEPSHPRSSQHDDLDRLADTVEGALDLRTLTDVVGIPLHQER